MNIETIPCDDVICKNRYYAMYIDEPGEIVIFTSMKQRDDWVKYEDEFSKMNDLSDEYDRIPLKEEEAIALIGIKNLVDAENHEDFMVLPGVTVAFSDERLASLKRYTYAEV